MTGTVAIVDTYAPTRGLPERFAELGWSCVRVCSTPEVPSLYRPGYSETDPLFVDTVVHHGDLEETAVAVAKHSPDLVIAGGEMGVELADTLSETLGLITNGTALSPARRHKWRQIETVRAAGLRTASQFTSDDPAAVADWHRRTGGRVVVKPVRSAAGDGVHFCDTPEETADACRRVLGARNVFAARNDDVVVQEYLSGTEYIVDTVSRDGHHRICDIWSYDKLSANGVPDLIAGSRLLPRRGEVQDLLVPYAKEVLDALGVRHGPAHLEIKLTPDGPCLVEVGVRLAGLSLPYLTPAAIGESQIDWTVLAYTDPAAFLSRYEADYRLERHLQSVYFISPVEGTLAGYPLMAAVEALESRHRVQINTAEGGRIRRTVDDTGWPVVVHLVHPLEEVVRRDTNTLRHLDGPGFYRLAETA